MAEASAIDGEYSSLSYGKLASIVLVLVLVLVRSRMFFEDEDEKEDDHEDQGTATNSLPVFGHWLNLFDTRE
jgi:hypothetical protein